MSLPGWPTEHPATALFLLDASHPVDEALLQQWLTEQIAKVGYVGAAEQVVVAIARDPENIPTQALARALKLPANTLVVPLRVVWSTSIDDKTSTPRLRDLLMGNRRRPNAFWARRMLKNSPEKAQCIAGAPATLADLSKRGQQRYGEGELSSKQFADYVAAQAGLALDIAERRLRGSRYKVPRQVAKNLQASARFKDVVAQLHAESGQPVAAIQAEAAAIMKELISIPRTFWLDVMAVFNRKMIGLGYEPEMVIDQEGLVRIRQMSRENPTALLWTHKTHVDGFAVHSLFFENDFPAPHILGGVNMAFGGLGFLARRAGAIFIRRSFQDNPLYKQILRQYIGYLLEKRFPLTWAFEGTRSRVGKLMPPRYGLLKYVVEAAHVSGARDLHIIPIAMSYDLIGDVRDYAGEQAGEVKRPESLSWFIGYLRGLRQPMGRIYVDFGEPVILAESPSPDDSLALSKIAFEVGVQVNKVTPITLASLATTILLGASPRALTEQEFLDEMQALVKWARARGIRLTSDFDAGKEQQRAAMADMLVDNGLITRYDAGPEIVYAIGTDQHGVANYYRNTTIHHFVNKAIIELSLMYVAGLQEGQVPAFWREAERLRDLFKFEFFYAPTEAFRTQVSEEMRRYDVNWEFTLEQEPGAAMTMLSSFQPLVAQSTLLSFTEGYRVVADVLARTPEDQALAEKDCVNQCLTYGRQAYLQRRISSEASIGKLLFQNGYKLMANMALTEAGDSNLGERRRAVSADFRELAHRIDIVRTIALPR